MSSVGGGVVHLFIFLEQRGMAVDFVLDVVVTQLDLHIGSGEVEVESVSGGLRGHRCSEFRW